MNLDFGYQPFNPHWNLQKSSFVNEFVRISKGCNASFVTIIMKVVDPIGLGHFRPISLIRCLQDNCKVVSGNN